MIQVVNQMTTPFSLLTVTWSGDRTHFSLLNESLKMSPFATLPHYVVVQHEDMAEFCEYAGGNTSLCSSADVLPVEVERMRQRARVWQKVLGRNLTRLSGSFARITGRPQWVRFTGWHTQQISKLAFVAASPVDTVVILDSDLIVTPFACTEDFVAGEKIICYRDLRPCQDLKGKVLHWQQTAHNLFGDALSSSAYYDGYYDTPFVMHAPTVRAMLSWLEQRYQKPWWRVLLQQPPRRWSEFGIYKQYLRHSETPVEWREAAMTGYLFDASDVSDLAARFSRMLREKQSRYITIHSQSSGRQLWTAEMYADAIRAELKRADHGG